MPLSVLILFVFLSFPALGNQGLGVFSDLTLGPGFRSGTLGVAQSKRSDDQSNFRLSAWNLSGGFTSAEIQNQGTGVLETTRTSEFDAGLGFQFQKNWEIDTKVSTNRTEETKFSERGGEIGISYRHEFSQNDKFDFDDSQFNFQPSLKVGIITGAKSVQQKLNLTILNRNIEREVNLEQTSTELNFQGNPAEWISVRISFIRFNYDRSKSDLQMAFQNRFLNSRSETLINTIASLPEQSHSIRLVFFGPHEVDYELGRSRTIHLVDGFESITETIKATKHFQSLSLGLGLQQHQSEGNANTGSVSLSFDVPI